MQGRCLQGHDDTIQQDQKAKINDANLTIYTDEHSLFADQQELETASQLRSGKVSRNNPINKNTYHEVRTRGDFGRIRVEKYNNLYHNYQQ